MKNNNHLKRKEILKTIMWVLFVIAIGILLSFFHNGSKLFSSFSFFIKTTSLPWSYGFAFMFGNKSIDSYIKKLNWTKNLKKANIISLLMFIIYGIIVCITVPYIFDQFVYRMTDRDLVNDVFVKTVIGISLDMTFISIFYSTYLTKYWKKSIEANEELKRENLLAKYEALKNQVNPHFLFNSLNTLSGLVEQKPELATDFIKKLSDIYRYVLEQNEKELVSINDELKFVEDYIFLSQMRFGKGLIFKSCLIKNQNFQVAPLGIQMVVENAIKHNIISDDMPLKIEMESENGFIVVKNNLQKKKTIISGKEPLGLENLKKRYVYLSGVAVEVIESNGKFIVKLPIIEP
jgi:sensor histidine kinase YesM